MDVAGVNRVSCTKAQQLERCGVVKATCQGTGAAEAGCERSTGIIDRETKLESNANWKLYLITY